MLFRYRLVLLAVFLLAFDFAEATQNIVSVTTTSSSNSPSNSDGYTFDNTVQALTSFSTGSGTYATSSLSDNVFVRRNSTAANQSSVWYTSNSAFTEMSGVHANDYGSLLHGNNILGGSDNTFANNNTSSPSQVGNVERIDFTWNAPITVTSAMAFAVFERGAAAAHDGFGIAAVTAIDVHGNPTAFGSLLKVASGWGGATNAVADMPYRLFRYGAGDDISSTTDSTGTGTQGLGGIVLTGTDLGLTNGTKIFGYALTGYDVTATTSAQVLDWLNSTYYPTDTDANTGGGGIDLASLNGLRFAAVPEPVTLPAIVLSGAVFAGYNVFVRRRRARRAV